MRALLLALLLLGLTGAAALAVEPGERLADPALEARARALSGGFRCLVCQNQSIDDSNADLAHDLRVLIRQRIAAGDSDAQVRQFLVSRYGDFILLEPPVKPATYLLWAAPFAVLLLGAGAAAVYFRRRRGALPESAAPLSPEEQRRLEQLLAEGGEG
ncbi:MAG TPA: cytochrome c-type biogenesis protein [Stellaceae bacterium]|nr:cytochrome c-type biogenesis protein [Stellaceae bacterium]